MFVYIRSAAFIIVVTQKLVLQQPKYVTAKCTETLLPPPCIQFYLDAPNVCLSFVLLFTIFIIVVTQKLVLHQSKNVSAKCTETLLPPPCIQFSLPIPIPEPPSPSKLIFSIFLFRQSKALIFLLN